MEIQQPIANHGLVLDAPGTSKIADRFALTDVLLSVALAVAVTAVYWPTRAFHPIYFDDRIYVFDNPNILSGLNWQTFKWAFSSATGGLWQPLTMLSFLIDIRLFGPNAGAMHLENAFFHAFSSAGWYALFRGMTGRRMPSLFVAALFALHPARVESVAWITERKDVLSMLMLVISLIAYWRFSRTSAWAAYLLSLGFFALALMSKAMMVTQPVLMLLLDLWPLGRTRYFDPVDSTKAKPPLTIRHLLLEKIPFFILSAAAGATTIATQSAVGASSSLQELTFENRLATASLGYVRYLGTIFVPRNLAVFYPYEVNRPIATTIAALMLLVLISAVIWRFRRSAPFLLVGWIWYLVALFPVIGFFQAGDQSMADRFTYLPSVGLTFATVWTVTRWIDRRRSTGRKTAAVVGGVIALVCCVSLTRAYLPCWSDTFSLFTKAAQVNGALDWNIEYELGLGCMDNQRPDLAIEHFDRTVKLLPNHAGAQINLANLLLRFSPARALPHYEAVIKLKPLNARAHFGYANCLSALGRDSDAKVEFEKARKLQASGG